MEATVLNEDPWKIQQAHTNGTITLLRNNYHERMNIRRIRPFLNKLIQIILERQNDIKSKLNEDQTSVRRSF